MFIIRTVQEWFYITVITKRESKIQHCDLKLIYDYAAVLQSDWLISVWITKQC